MTPHAAPGRGAAPAARPPAVRVATPQALRWHGDLLARLRRELGSDQVALDVRSGAPEPRDGLLLRSLVPGLGRAPADAVTPAMRRDGVTIELEGRAAPRPEAGTLVPLFDGRPGTNALLAALLAGRSPQLQVRREPSGEIVAQGCAGLDAAATLAEAFDAVTARLGTLLAWAIRCAPDRPSTGDAAPIDEPAPPVGSAALLQQEARRLVSTAVRSTFRLGFYPGHWHIGWRFVADDQDVCATGGLSGERWNVLASPAHTFFADPFPFTHGGRQYLFFEAFDHRRSKGHIAAVAFGPAGPEGPVFTVLQEPWHLSYPFILEYDGQVWMVPESVENRTCTLYRADPFPTRWTREADLLVDLEAGDATLLAHEGRWWMFATVRDGVGSWSDMLAIYMAPTPLGPWKPHRRNPVLISGEAARAAGRFVRRDGRLWRPVQDCRILYGAGLGLAEVTRLDEDGFAQVLRATLRPGGPWPGRRMHTLNRDGRLEVIDGSAHSLRLAGWLAGKVPARGHDATLLAPRPAPPRSGLSEADSS
jgi:hypothetical protein